MASIIFAILFLVAGIAIGAYMLKEENIGIGIGVLLGGIILSVVILALGCFTTVPTGHTGVVTTFGAVEDRVLDAGINTKAPWQTVKKIDNRVQKCSVTLSCFSSDIQEVTITYTLNYQIDKNHAQELYKTVGMSYYDTVVSPNVAEAVKVETALHTAEKLVGSRAILAENIEKNLSEALAKYNIVVVSAAIEDMDFTDAFTNAVESKQVAAQNKLQAEIEQAQKVMEQEAAAQMAVIQANATAETAKIQAQAKAETAKIQAEADLEVTKIQADAAEYAGQKEAAKNKAVSESLTEDLLRYYYINQWNGSLPDTYVGSDDVSTIINGSNSAE